MHTHTHTHAHAHAHACVYVCVCVCQSQEQQPETANHITSTVKSRRRMDMGMHASTQSTFFTFIGSRTQGEVPSSFRLGLLSSIHAIRIIPANTPRNKPLYAPCETHGCISSSQTPASGLRLSITCRSKFRLPTSSRAPASGLLAP